MEEGWSEEAPATNGFSETRLVLKIQHLESEYRNRVDRLEKDYDSRIRSLAHVLMKAFRDIPTDPMINTMERNPVSKEYIAARVNEILKEAVQNDTENNIKSLTKRLSNTETEVSRWKKEYRKVTGDMKRVKSKNGKLLQFTQSLEKKASETKMKLESARLSSKELQKTIEAQAKKIKELQGLEDSVESLTRQLASSESRARFAAKEAEESKSVEHKRRVVTLESNLMAKSQEITKLMEEAERSAKGRQKMVEEAVGSTRQRYEEKLSGMKEALRVRETAIKGAKKALQAQISTTKLLGEKAEEWKRNAQKALKSEARMRKEFEEMRAQQQDTEVALIQARDERDRAKCALQEAERERLGIKRKYFSLGERIEGLLKQEDAASAHAKELLESKRQALKKELIAEKKARRHEHRVHMRTIRGLEATNLELRKSIAHATERLKEYDENMREIDRDTAELKQLKRDVSEKEAIIIKIRSEKDVLKAQFLSDSAAAGRAAQAKVEALLKEMEEEKRSIHRQYQRLLTEKADGLQKLIGARENKLEKRLIEAQATISHLTMELETERKREKLMRMSLSGSSSMGDYHRGMMEKAINPRKQFENEIKQIRKGMTSLEKALDQEKHRAKQETEKRKKAESRARSLSASLEASRKKKMFADTEQQINQQEITQQLEKASSNLARMKAALEAERKRSHQLEKTVRAQAKAAARVMSLEKALSEKGMEASQLSVTEQGEATKSAQLVEELKAATASLTELQTRFNDYKTLCEGKQEDMLQEKRRLEADLDGHMKKARLQDSIKTELGTMLGMVHRYKAECQKLKTYTRSVIEEMRKGVAEGVINMHRNAESAAVYATKPFMGDGGHDEEDESSERRREAVHHATTDIQSMSIELERSRGRLKAAKTQIDELRGKLEIADSKLAALSSLKIESEKELATLDLENKGEEELRKIIAECKLEERKAKEECEIIRGKFEALERSLFQTEEERSGAEADSHQLSRRVRSLEKCIKSRQEDVQSILKMLEEEKHVKPPLDRKTIEALKVGSSDSSSSSDDDSVEKNGKEKNNQGSNEEPFNEALNVLRVALKSTFKELKGRGEQAEQLANTVSRLQQSLLEATQEAEKAEKRADDAVKERKAADEKGKVLETNLRKAKLEMKEIETESKLNLELAMIDAIEPYKRNIQSLKRTIAGLETKLDQSASELQQYRDSLPKQEQQKQKQAVSEQQPSGTMSLTQQHQQQPQQQHHQSLGRRTVQSAGSPMARKISAAAAEIAAASAAAVVKQMEIFAKPEEQHEDSQQKQQQQQQQQNQQPNIFSQSAMSSSSMSEYDKGLQDIQDTLRKARAAQAAAKNVVSELERDRSFRSTTRSEEAPLGASTKAVPRVPPISGLQLKLRSPEKSRRRQSDNKHRRKNDGGKAATFTSFDPRRESSPSPQNDEERSIEEGQQSSTDSRLSLWQLDRSRRSGIDANPTDFSPGNTRGLEPQTFSGVEVFVPDDNDFQMPDKSPMHRTVDGAAADVVGTPTAATGGGASVGIMDESKAWK